MAEQAPSIKEVGIKIKLYGISYSNLKVKELIDRKIKEIKDEVKERDLAIRLSPEKPVVHHIQPLSAYDYG